MTTKKTKKAIVKKKDVASDAPVETKDDSVKVEVLTTAPPIADTPKTKYAEKRTLVESVDFLIKRTSKEFFEKRLPDLLQGKYKVLYPQFVAGYNGNKNGNTELSEEVINGVFCLLVYVDLRYIPMYDSSDIEMYLRTPQLMEVSNWHHDFTELITPRGGYARTKLHTDNLKNLI